MSTTVNQHQNKKRNRTLTPSQEKELEWFDKNFSFTGERRKRAMTWDQLFDSAKK